MFVGINGADLFVCCFVGGVLVDVGVVLFVVYVVVGAVVVVDAFVFIVTVISGFVHAFQFWRLFVCGNFCAITLGHLAAWLLPGHARRYHLALSSALS